MNTDRSILALSIFLVVLGFFIPLWQLQCVGIILAGVSGRYILALLLGLLVDIAYGAPLGLFHAVSFPFTLLAFCSALAWFVGRRFILNKNISTRL